MKKLFIINTYPKTQKQKQILKDCIKSLELINWDILIVSHSPIPIDVQEMVSYCIYDKNNLFVNEKINDVSKFRFIGKWNESNQTINLNLK